jgi:hypothetical protein
MNVRWKDLCKMAKIRNSKNLTFGDAIKRAKEGCKVARQGWNGKGMYIAYMPGMKLAAYNDQSAECRVNDRTSGFVGKDTELEILPYFAMFTADKKWLPGWLASQTDMLADDWVVVYD